MGHASNMFVRRCITACTCTPCTWASADAATACAANPGKHKNYAAICIASLVTQPLFDIQQFGMPRRRGQGASHTFHKEPTALQHSVCRKSNRLRHAGSKPMPLTFSAIPTTCTHATFAIVWRRALGKHCYQQKRNPLLAHKLQRAEHGNFKSLMLMRRSQQCTSSPSRKQPLCSSSHQLQTMA